MLIGSVGLGTGFVGAGLSGSLLMFAIVHGVLLGALGWWPTPRCGSCARGWMSGKVFDLTGSYHAAFINGIGWNLLNMTNRTLLLSRVRAQQRRQFA